MLLSKSNKNCIRQKIRNLIFWKEKFPTGSFMLNQLFYIFYIVNLLFVDIHFHIAVVYTADSNCFVID